jgi:hypothetical protein
VLFSKGVIHTDSPTGIARTGVEDERERDRESARARECERARVRESMRACERARARA